MNTIRFSEKNTFNFANYGNGQLILVLMHTNKSGLCKLCLGVRCTTNANCAHYLNEMARISGASCKLHAL